MYNKNGRRPLPICWGGEGRKNPQTTQQNQVPPKPPREWIGPGGSAVGPGWFARSHAGDCSRGDEFKRGRLEVQAFAIVPPSAGGHGLGDIGEPQSAPGNSVRGMKRCERHGLRGSLPACRFLG